VCNAITDIMKQSTNTSR